MEIAPAQYRPPPIRRTPLKKAMLERIALVHEALRDVLAANNGPMSLEQFELCFMRSQSPAEELKAWEAIVLALDKAQDFLPPDQYDRKALYDRLVLMLCGALTDEERGEQKTKVLLRCFHSSYPWPASASSNRPAAAQSAPNAVVAATCLVCCNRVSRSGAVFCPRCGGRLPKG
ncbi:MAG: hypothetical protein ACREIT_03120 [Tepidisphaeraceae bacterium]